MLHISDMLTEGGYERGLHYQVIGDYEQDPLPLVLKWTHPTDPYPTQQQLSTWEVAAQAKLNAQVAVATARLGLRDKVALAKTYASDIKVLWNVCLDQLETNASHPSRFNAVLAAVNALPTALKNRVNKGTADPTLASTDILKDAYCDHVLLIAGNLAILLSFG